MKRYNLINDILGWVCFAVAAVTYLLTVEPTASFWDCPEFISQGCKLEVGHPPGNPIFMLAARFFVNFAFGDVTKVALMVNSMSALLSAATILLLFWTITHLVKRLIIRDNAERLSLTQMLVIFGSGICGALAYTWSDTFWLSAVEGEVYAFSSFCTALVFWLILKWENRADQPHSDKYLILIAYVIGISIAVHLLNLLCIPAIGLVIYYRLWKDTSATGSLITLAVSAIVVGLILYGLVPGFIEVSQYFELFFVNTLGFSYNVGVLFYAILAVASFIWAIRELYRQTSVKRIRWSVALSILLSGIPFIGNSMWIPVVIMAGVIGYLFWSQKLSVRILNLVVMSIFVIFIGYSSYALLLIRSSANPPMNQNAPDNVFALASYLNREQYGERPLFYGQTHQSSIVYEADPSGQLSPQYSNGAPQYSKVTKSSPDQPDKYIFQGYKKDYRMSPELDMLFPRIYSGAHTQAYSDWIGGIKGTPTKVTQYVDSEGNVLQYTDRIKPTFGESLRFFLVYQLNHMYWRYFMWNFAGRQNDLQGNGELEHGNWITGFSWFDNWRLGNQDLLPDELKNNKGHNVFYCLPLLLGLIGLFWQSLRKGPNGIRQFWVVFFLFFMTGLAIVIYLNQTPMQPRERDYAYAGSFYAFAIWCGLGVAAIIEEINRKLKGHETVVAAIVGAACLLVPVQMASQTWDDHDRSGRYTCRDFGQNYLMSLQKEGNPIIYTNGDNDTFPLWYNQDVEGVRTDARVCNLSYLQTDWYIDQMRRPAYDSPSVPITWNRLEYCSGTNEYVQLNPMMKESIKELYKTYPEEAKKMFGDEPFELKNILKYWVRNDVDENQREVMTLLTGGDRGSIHVIPTDTVYVTIDKKAVKKSGMMMATDSIPDKMVISLAGKRALYKGDLMMLEMIAQSNWVRPIYVALTVGQDNYMNLGDNFIQEGLVNRITPFTTNTAGAKNFDTKRSYDVMMNKFKFGGIDKKGIYIDETVMRMCHTNRRVFVQLAMNLAAEGQTKKAAEVLAYLDKNIPEYNVPVDYSSGSLDEARVYAAIGNKAAANHLIKELWKKSSQYLNWYLSLEGIRFTSAQRECMINLHIMQQAAIIANETDPTWAEKKLKELEIFAERYQNKGGKFGIEG